MSIEQHASACHCAVIEHLCRGHGGVQGLKQRDALASAPAAHETGPALGAGVATDDATTISGKGGEHIVLTSAKLKGSDWLLADLEVRTPPLVHHIRTSISSIECIVECALRLQAQSETARCAHRNHARFVACLHSIDACCLSSACTQTFLLDLQDCTVLLHGPMQALYLHRLTRCHVQGGPVGGATLGERLCSCTLMVATHQMRLHHVTDTDVYVRPGSDPIIEHCSNIGFAPLAALPYGDFDAAMAAAELPMDADDCNWQNVKDFQYPGHAQSPNWHIVASDARTVAKSAA
jgi:Tubulin binding cofactor C